MCLQKKKKKHTGRDLKKSKPIADFCTRQATQKPSEIWSKRDKREYVFECAGKTLKEFKNRTLLINLP